MTLTIGDLSCYMTNHIVCPQCRGDGLIIDPQISEKYPTPCDICRGIGQCHVRSDLGADAAVVFDKTTI